MIIIDLTDGNRFSRGLPFDDLKVEGNCPAPVVGWFITRMVVIYFHAVAKQQAEVGNVNLPFEMPVFAESSSIGSEHACEFVILDFSIYAILP